jgi:hypothetical protein
MRRGAPWAGVALVFSLTVAGCSHARRVDSAEGSSGCRPADGVRTESRLDFLKELVSSSDIDHAASRRDLGIARMNPNKVKLVTREQDCQAVVNEINRVREEAGTVRQVWLYALGNAGYAVDDPDLDVGFADRVLIFFGPDFIYKVTYSGF